MVRLLYKPKVIIYRFVDVLITKGRIKNDYIQYTSENIFEFLNEFWGESELMRLVDAIRDQSYDDRELMPLVPIVFKECQNPKAIQDSVCLYVNWKCKHTGQPTIGNYRNPHNQLIRLVVLYSMAKDKAKITIHDRYKEAIKSRNQDGIRQIILSRITCSLVDHTRQLMTFTTQGEMNQYFDGYFNTLLYPPKDVSTYETIASMLNVNCNDILFISSSQDECRIAKKAMIQVIKVKRPGEGKNKEFVRVQDMSAIVFGPRNSVAKTDKIGKTCKARMTKQMLKSEKSQNVSDEQRSSTSLSNNSDIRTSLLLDNNSSSILAMPKKCSKDKMQKKSTKLNK